MTPSIETVVAPRPVHRAQLTLLSPDLSREHLVRILNDHIDSIYARIQNELLETGGDINETFVLVIDDMEDE